MAHSPEVLLVDEVFAVDVTRAENATGIQFINLYRLLDAGSSFFIGGEPKVCSWNSEFQVLRIHLKCCSWTTHWQCWL